MAEYSADALQTINPGEDAIFYDVNPCRRGLVRHRNGAGTFLLSGATNVRCHCNSGPSYFVDFGANIAVPEGQTVGPISVAFVIDGSVVPATEMIVTPAAVDDFFNVSRASLIDIWAGCCETIAIRNTSTIPISMQNANVSIERKSA